MPEASTTLAASAATGVTLASLFTDIDAPTLMGALSGASVFVISAKDLKPFIRMLYLIISSVMGYLSGPSVLGHLFKEPAICAFVFSAMAIGLALKLIKGTESLDVNKWFRPN